MNDPRISLPLSVVNALAAYLSERPWKEANPLLKAIEEHGKSVEAAPQAADVATAPVAASQEAPPA